MRFWRWILVALVVLTLGSVLLPTTSSAADRSLQVLQRGPGINSGQSATRFWSEPSGLTGDPDSGGGFTGEHDGLQHSFRVQDGRSPGYLSVSLRRLLYSFLQYGSR